MKPMTTEQMDLVKATVPTLIQYGETIMKRFYQRMLESHPELKNLFNLAHQKTGMQPKALAAALCAYAANIHHLDVLDDVFLQIEHKHASLGIRPEHYPIVGQHLLAAFAEMRGDIFDSATLKAWGVAYAQFAELLISAEAQLYEKAAWSGYRPFKVLRKVAESDEITSFYLLPADGGAVPVFNPGQYVAVNCYIAELGVHQMRQYSLSDAPHRRWLRISVKRITGAGCYVSTFLHDKIEAGDCIDLTAPMGIFILNSEALTPVVLISAGVGITPMVAMASALLMKPDGRQVHFVHACRSGRVHAFREWLNEAAAGSSKLTRKVFYEKPGPDDCAGKDYDYEGRLTAARIQQHALVCDADYYICGPAAFMSAQCAALRALGVAAEQLHTEIFDSGLLAGTARPVRWLGVPRRGTEGVVGLRLCVR